MSATEAEVLPRISALWEKSVRTLAVPAAFGSALFIISLMPAIAAPVTSADLSGKKFCWDGGGTENYYADGK